MGGIFEFENFPFYIKNQPTQPTSKLIQDRYKFQLIHPDSPHWYSKSSIKRDILRENGNVRSHDIVEAKEEKKTKINLQVNLKLEFKFALNNVTVS